MLIPKSDFIGLEKLTHLSAGGESPTLKSHRVAVEQFFADKALGEVSRERMDETVKRCKQKVGVLLGVSPDDVAFISTSSEGINLLAYGFLVFICWITHWITFCALEFRPLRAMFCL